MRITNALALCVVLFSGDVAADTLIHAGRLIDGNSDRVRAEMTVRVHGTDIRAIENGYSVAGGRRRRH